MEGWKHLGLENFPNFYVEIFQFMKDTSYRVEIMMLMGIFGVFFHNKEKFFEPLNKVEIAFGNVGFCEF